MRRAIGGLVAVVATALVLLPSAALADTGVELLHFKAGPYEITPGANLILLQANQVPKPAEDGYMVRMAPNLRYARRDGSCCGAVPRVDVLHLHHGVWLSSGSAGQGEGNSYGPFYPFMAVGEEKTILEMPAGYGYPIGASDAWFLNYMIHNLTATAAKVYITYDIDFVPMSSPLAASIKPVHPIWMDVQAHNIYPVFNVIRGSGRDGKFTYPDMANNPYGSQPSLNEFKVDHPGVLVGTGGHLHPGGLYDDLELIRAGATPSGGAIAGSVPNSVRLFRSMAHYFDSRGPISWDLAMTVTPADWRPQVQAGDVLRVSTTYETRRASWYESMGIMVAWEAWNDQSGVDPFTQRLDENGHITHGHLPENDHHGGSSFVGISLRTFPQCPTRTVIIAGFRYNPGDFKARGSARCIPTVKQGRSLTFLNQDAAANALFNPLNPDPNYLASIFHTITTCQSPCGLNTGISYPLANGPANYDSAQLGVGLPASGRLSWSTPTTLPPGTYTFFCRIHPFMRGVFRVIR